MKGAVKELIELLQPWVNDWSVRWSDASARTVRSVAAARLARDAAIIDTISTHDDRFQPGLFDRRADRANETNARTAAAAYRLIVDRAAHVERWSDAHETVPRVVLALLP